MFDPGSPWIQKLIGAASGTILALLRTLPNSISDALMRAVFSFGAGFLFAELIQVLIEVHLGLPMKISLILASAIAAYVSWPLGSWINGLTPKTLIEMLKAWKK